VEAEEIVAEDSRVVEVIVVVVVSRAVIVVVLLGHEQVLAAVIRIRERLVEVRFVSCKEFPHNYPCVLSLILQYFHCLSRSAS
jgi:hypothetical protein